jgi:hypothetical protein
MLVYVRLLAFIGAYLPSLGVGRKRGLLARAWRAVLSPSPALLDGARDGGVAERLKAHAWKVCMRETVSRVRIPPPPPLNTDK